MITYYRVKNRVADYYGSLKKRVNNKKYSLRYENDPYNQKDSVLTVLSKSKNKFPLITDELCENLFEGELLLQQIFDSKGY
jgi:hypothetical protein